MIELGYTIRQAQGQFFTAQRVIEAMDAATRRVLSRFGAYVRRRARSSIRRGGKRGHPSKPGKPPKSWTGLLKNHIYFVFDPQQESVIIGPAKLNTGTEAPQVLEYGGTTNIETKKQTVRVKIKPRPYMRPAFEKELPNLNRLWQDVIR